MKNLSTGIHHIGIPTKDLEATVRFYEKLGGEKYFTKDSLYTDGNGTEHDLSVALVSLYGETIEIYNLGTGAGVGNIDHIAFSVADIAETEKTLKAKGFTVVDHGISEGWPSGRGEYIVIVGVNGERIEFIQDAWK